MHETARQRQRCLASVRQFPIDAPGSAACGRSGLPLVAVCGNAHRRIVPFRLLRTDGDDRSPLYARPFVCKACGSREVTLFAVDGQAELDMLRPELLPTADKSAPSNSRAYDPGADLP